MAGWTPAAIAAIQAVGNYDQSREGAAENDGRKATLHPQHLDARFVAGSLQPFPDLTQPHMTLAGRTRHTLHVRVKGEEFQASPPWDEYGIQVPRIIEQVDTRTSIRQAPVLQPVEFRTWTWTPQMAAEGK